MTTRHINLNLNCYPNNARIRKQALELRLMESMPINDLRELYGLPKLPTKREIGRIKDLRHAHHG